MLFENACSGFLCWSISLCPFNHQHSTYWCIWHNNYKPLTHQHFLISVHVSFYCPLNGKAEYFCFIDLSCVLNNNNILLRRHLWTTKISSHDFTLTNANILPQFLPRPSWFPCDTVSSPDVNFTQWAWNETLTWVQYNCCSDDIIQEYISSN